MNQEEGREVVRNLLREAAKDWKPRDYDKITIVNGRRMVKPMLANFPQEAVQCSTGKYCYAPSENSHGLVWHGAIIQCKKCGQRYEFGERGWIARSAFGAWCLTHEFFIIGLFAFGIVSIITTLLGVAPWQIPF